MRDHVSILLSSLETARASAQDRADEADRDRKFLDKLEAIRGTLAEHLDPKQSDADYARAFREYGLDLDVLDPKEAGARIAKHASSAELIAYHRRLGRSCGDICRSGRTHRDGVVYSPRRARPIGTNGARRCACRSAATTWPPSVAWPAMNRALSAQKAPSVIILAKSLSSAGDRVLAEKVLIHAWRNDPGDFWVNSNLGY